MATQNESTPSTKHDDVTIPVSSDNPSITTSAAVSRDQLSKSHVESYDHVLTCLICRSDFDEHEHQPKFLPCFHTFCKACLRQYVAQRGDEDIECPSCRHVSTLPVAGVTALQTNFYIKHIQSLVITTNPSENLETSQKKTCAKHPEETTLYYCSQCEGSICVTCCMYTCTDHTWRPLSVMTETSHQRLHEAFKRASSLIHHKQMETKAQISLLSNSKDEALKSIDNAVEQHSRTLHRRGTLLKQNVIDIYNEHVNQLETALDDMETAMTCIVSTKEHQEKQIGEGAYTEIYSSIDDIEDVYTNVCAKVKTVKSSITFENQYGLDKFNMAAKSLGRVRMRKVEDVEKSPSETASPRISLSEDVEAKPTETGVVVRPRRFHSQQHE